MNLYLVYPKTEEFGCYVFANGHGQAKSLVYKYFHRDTDFIDHRIKSIKRNVSGYEEVCDDDCKRLEDIGIKYQDGN